MNRAGRILLVGALFLCSAAVSFGQLTFTEFPVPDPHGLTVGPDGALWFTSRNSISRMTTAGVVTATFSSGAPPIGSFYAITLGPDGKFWFVDFTQMRIGSMTTAGAFSIFTEVPAFPQAITGGPDGNIWFSEGTNAIGRIVAQYIAYARFPLSAFDTKGITQGPDGALWFADGYGHQIGRMTTAGSATMFPVPSGGWPDHITTGPDGNLWFTERVTGNIGRITPAGAMTEFRSPTASDEPVGITTGPDGALWFVEAAANKLGRITTTGAALDFPIPSRPFTVSSDPSVPTVTQEILTGPDGNLWFTAPNRIVRVSVPAVLIVPAVSPLGLGLCGLALLILLRRLSASAGSGRHGLT